MIPKYFLWIIISVKRFWNSSASLRMTTGKHQKLTQKTLSNNYQPTTINLLSSGTVHRYFNVFEKSCREIQYFQLVVIIWILWRLQTLNLLSSIFKEDFKYRLKLLLKEGLLKSNVYKKAKNLLVLDQSFDSAQPDKYKFLPIFTPNFLKNLINEYS